MNVEHRYKILNSEYSNLLQKGDYQNCIPVLNALAKCRRIEKSYIDELKLRILLFHFEISSKVHSTKNLKEIAFCIKALDFTKYDFEELYFKTVREDTAPKTDYIPSDEVFIAEKLLAPFITK